MAMNVQTDHIAGAAALASSGMPDTYTSPRPAEQTPRHAQTPERTSWASGVPMTIALLLVAAVWIGGCVWSFQEQTSYATSKGFRLPELLPLVIDGLAISMAAVAYAASLDARPAVFARLGTAIAVAMSACSNAAWAWERSDGDHGTVALAVAVPVLANLAFEVLVSEIRRRVLRKRGVPAPVKVPPPSLLRMALSPWSAFWEWRRLVLRATAPEVSFEAAERAARSGLDEVRQAPEVAELPGWRRALLSPAAGPEVPANGVSQVPVTERPELPAAGPGGSSAARRAGSSGRKQTGSGRRNKRAEVKPRRPAEETRRLAAELAAAEPALTQPQLAARLGISDRQLRNVLALPVSEPAVLAHANGNTPDLPVTPEESR